MFTVTLNAKCFGGLAVEIDANADGMDDARFASSGNALPRTMFDKLMSSDSDMMALSDLVGEAYYDAGMSRAYRRAMRI